jgi:hypothetical protein
VSEDDAHRSNNNVRSVGAFPVKPRAFGVPLCGIGLDRSARRANPAIVPSMRCFYDATRLSDNVRQIECWFSQIMS